MMMETSEELHPYISVCANIRLLMKEAGLPLDALVAHGRSMMRWSLDNQDSFADSAYSNVGEARHCWRKSSWRIDPAIPKNRTSPCGTISIVGAIQSAYLQQMQAMLC
jgi:hypothetical protein